MKGKEGETKRVLIASSFMLLTVGSVLGGIYCMAKGFVILGLEEWLKAALFFGLAVLAFPAALWSWKRLRRYRAQNGITEQLRSRFRDDRSARAKFYSTLLAHDVFMFLAGIFVMLFFVVFPKAAAQPLGDGVQFLTISGALAVLLGYMVLVLHRTLAGYVPDEEAASRLGEAEAPSRPGDAGPPSRLRRTVVVVLTLVFAGAGAFLLVLGGSVLLSVWRIPSWGTSDIMTDNTAFLAAGLFCLYMAWSTLQSGWRPTRQLGKQRPVSPVDPVTSINFVDREV